MKKTIMTFVLVIAIAGEALAAEPDPCEPTPVGTAFTYQGRLIDDNVPGDGLYDMQFRLHAIPVGLLQVGPTLNIQDVGVTDGYFTVELDFGDVFNGDDRYLGIGIRSAGDPNYVYVSPRQRLTPTPYALRALSIPEFVGHSPVWVNNSERKIGLNAGTNPGHLMSWDGNNWVSRPPYTHRAESNLQPYLCVNFIIALQGMYPSRNSISDPTIAEITMFGGNFAPRSWALCDGQLLPIVQNQSLYSILGTTYGGDGRTTFGLPDLRGRVPMHVGSGPGLTNRKLGEKGGTETITPQHNN